MCVVLVQGADCGDARSRDVAPALDNHTDAALATNAAKCAELRTAQPGATFSKIYPAVLCAGVGSVTPNGRGAEQRKPAAAPAAARSAPTSKLIA
jgi:hypothetical protein